MKLSRAQKVALFNIIVDHGIATDRLCSACSKTGEEAHKDMQSYYYWTESRDVELLNTFGVTFGELHKLVDDPIYLKRRAKAA